MTGAPSCLWLCALYWVLYVLNHSYCEAIDGIPMTKLSGQTVDTSNMFQFRFYEKAWCATGAQLSNAGKPSFPSEDGEEACYVVGFGESVGDVMTFKVLTHDTNKILYRSNVRSADSEDESGTRRPHPGDKDANAKEEPRDLLEEHVKSPKTRHPFDNSVYMDNEGEMTGGKFKTFLPEELLHRSYLTPIDEKGQRFRARIVEQLIEPDSSVKFRVTYDHDDRNDEVLTYNEILDFVEKEISANLDPDKVVWSFQEIVAHEGPLRSTDPSYNGSLYNVKVLWSDGSTTYEPLNVIAADDPVTCALYARKHNLLDTDGWKRFRRIAKNEKKLTRFLNQAKLQSKRTAKRYQYGYEVPKSPRHALELDRIAGNTKWQDSMALEFSQIMEYKTFEDAGKGDLRPAGYKRIKAHWVFAIKHDGRHKSRLVAGGHLTDTPIEDVYSGVVTIRSLRLVIFLAELNQLEIWGADIGNAYLEADTKEKVYVIGDQGFGDLCGHTLIIRKALYGLKSSGKRWHERFVDVLRSEGFFVSKGDNDVWMRDMGDHYEYIAVYVDDLAIASRNPALLIVMLKEKYKFKIKGDGPISFHLGCDFIREKDGTLIAEPQKYLEKMIKSHELMFSELPSTLFTSPLEPNDHPEMDDTTMCDEDETAKYLSMIGQLHWIVTLGRFDVMSATVTMARFRAAPRVGHLRRLRRIYGYLRNKRFRHGGIRYRTGRIQHEVQEFHEYNWMYSVDEHFQASYILSTVHQLIGFASVKLQLRQQRMVPSLWLHALLRSRLSTYEQLCVISVFMWTVLLTCSETINRWSLALRYHRRS